MTFALVSPKLWRIASNIIAANGAWRSAGRALNSPTSHLSAKDEGPARGDSSAPLATSYDEIPYPRLAFSYTHPSHLATVGRLLGLRPASVDRCRVLELGCASGSNLVPMAYALPSSQWVGIDLSERQIADGREFVAALGLTNVVLEQMDICEAAESLAARFEPFDYIIAHGIYSWVPDSVKAALLATYRRMLAPEGIAYVSYNCNPGGHLREIIRRICQYHGRNESGPRVFIAKIRGFLESLLQMLPEGDDPYRIALIEQAANLLAERDSVILHDVLERDNDSRLLHQFLAEAANHGMQYLGDAHFSHTVGIGIDSAGLAAIRQDGDVIDFQQRLDFLYGRALRATLLCREEIAVRHEVVPEAVHDLWIASGAAIVSPDGIKLTAGQVDRIKVGDASPLKFRTDECTTTIASRVGKAAMLELCAAHPTPLSFEAFVDQVRRRLGAPNDAPVADQLAQMAIRWFAIRLVELSAFDPPIADGLDDRPIASAVARYQVANRWSAADPLPNEAGLPDGAADDSVAHHVTNLLHRRIYLGGELVAQVIKQLDGHHDRAAIVESLAAPVLRGEATMQLEGKPVTDVTVVRRILSDRVDSCIADLARNALLVREPGSG